MNNEIVNSEIDQEVNEENVPIFANVELNKTRKKRRGFNEYSVVTELVKEYKRNKDHAVMLEIISNLQGIINSYTIVVTPADPNQQIHLTKYILSFVGMFTSPSERADASNGICFQAIQRIRWIMRFYTYADLYSKLTEMIIEVINKMRVIGTCDCVYFIQKMIRFKMYDLVMKSTKDATTHVMHLPTESKDEDPFETFIDLHEDSLEFADNEEELIYELFYKNIEISSLVNEFEFYRVLTQYEKFLLYLKFSLQLTNRQIKSVIVHKTEMEIVEDLLYLEQKLLDVGQEYLLV